MDESLYILIIFAVLLIPLMVFTIITYAKSRRGGKPEYDERQMIARGKAAQAGFVTMIAYFVLCVNLDGLLVWCENSVDCMLGITLGLMVFSLVAIHKDAYLGLNENSKTFYLLGGGVSLGCFLISLPDLINGNMIVDGKLTTKVLAGLGAMALLVVLVALFLHNRKLKKKETAEEEV